MRVRLRRGRDFLRIVAFVLLTWTALDISALQLCALDRMDQAGSLSEARMSMADTPGGPISPPNHRADDCFCCSSSVEVGQVRPASLGAALTSALAAIEPKAPRSAGRSIFRPPQLS